MLLDWHFYYVAAVARELSRSADVMVVTRDHGYEIGVEGDATVAKRELLGGNVSSVFIRGRQSSPAALGSVARAARAVRDFGPDVVHVQTHSDWRLYSLQRAAAGIPACLTVHDVLPHLGSRWRLNRLQEMIDRGLLLRADAFVVHGESLAQLIRRQPWCREEQAVHVIPHVCPVRVVGGSPPAMEPGGRPTVLFFGRMEYYKGLDVLVEAARLVTSSLPELKVIVAGRGPEVDRIRETMDVPDNLFNWRTRFVPDVDLPQLFREAHVVVLPYREASQSGVIPLAFGYGRPVIATRVGALAEAVQEGISGLLVPSEDPRSLADAIVRFFSEEGLSEALTAGASSTARTGSMSARHVAELHLSMYGSMLGARCPRE